MKNHVITNLVSENHVSEITLIECTQNAIEERVDPMSKVFPKVSPIEKNMLVKIILVNIMLVKIALVKIALVREICKWLVPFNFFNYEMDVLRVS